MGVIVDRNTHSIVWIIFKYFEWLYLYCCDALVSIYVYLYLAEIILLLSYSFRVLLYRRRYLVSINNCWPQAEPNKRPGTR